ncbi:hypothetical protein TNCV_124191 [Trichonephila clavipes]|nr:hypothetical protein TNCV_124191 [Trichonephila clavipes]
MLLYFGLLRHHSRIQICLAVCGKREEYFFKWCLIVAVNRKGDPNITLLNLKTSKDSEKDSGLSVQKNFVTFLSESSTSTFNNACLISTVNAIGCFRNDNKSSNKSGYKLGLMCKLSFNENLPFLCEEASKTILSLLEDLSCRITALWDK